MKKTFKRRSFLLMGILAGAALSVGSTSAASTGTTVTDVVLTLTGGELCIGQTGTLDLGEYTISSSLQTVSAQFAAGQEFRVEDLKSDDLGWYTTIQTSNMSGTNGSIPAANISMRVDPAIVTLLSGGANPLVELEGAWSGYRAINNPLTFIERDDINAQLAGPNNGVVGKYGVLPFIQVDIPAYTPLGEYQAVISFTLMEN